MGSELRTVVGRRLMGWATWTSVLVASGVALASHIPSLPLDDPSHGGIDHVHHDHADEDLGAIDLTGYDLSNASLDGAKLPGAALDAATLDALTAVCSDHDDDSTTPKICASFAGASLVGASLQGAKLDDADLGGANLDNAVMRNVRLDRASLASANLIGTDLDGAQAPDSDLTGVDLTDARLDFAVLKDAKLSGANVERTVFDYSDLDGTELDAVSCQNPPCSLTSFRSATLRGARLVGTVLEQSDFGGADLSGSVWTSPGLAGLDLTDADLILATLDRVEAGCAEGAPIAECASLVDTRLRYASLRDARLSGASLLPTAAGEADLFDSDLTRADLSRVVATTLTTAPGQAWSCSGIFAASFEDALIAGARFDSAGLACADFTRASTGLTLGCIAPGPADPEEVTERCVDFTDADLRGARFAGAVLRTGIMTGALLESADFTNADLESTRFVRADLTSAVLTGSLLAGTIFTEASLDGTELTNAVMRGADLSIAGFSGAEFSAGASEMPATSPDTGTECTPAPGIDVVDLVGASVEDADLSGAIHFLRGCIAVDETTTYSPATRFPAGFGNLVDEMTEVPEPGAWLQLVSGAAALVMLDRRRLRRRHPERTKARAEPPRPRSRIDRV